MEPLPFLLLWGLPQIWGSSEGEWSKSARACARETARGGWAGKGGDPCWGPMETPVSRKPGAVTSLAIPPENLRLPASPPRLQAMWWSTLARRHQPSCPSPSILFSPLLLTLSAHPATRETTPISIVSQSSKGIPRSASSRSPLSRTAAGRAQTAQCGWGRCRPTLGAMIWTPSAS